MDLATLNTRLRVTNQQLTIDPSALGLDALNALFSRHLGGPVSLSAVTQPFELTAQALRIRGTGASLPFAGAAVEVIFRPVSNTELSIELTATTSTTWSMVDVFPVLATTPAAQLTFSSFQGRPASVFTLRSHEKPGLSLAGTVQPKAFAQLGFIAGRVDHYAVEGPFSLRPIDDPFFNPRGFSRDQRMVVPSFTLFASLPPLSSPLPLTLQDLECALSISPYFDSVYSAWEARSGFVFTGALAWGDSKTKIPLSAALTGEPFDRVAFKADLTKVVGTSLRGLSSLLGAKVGSPLEQLSLDTLIDLSELELQIELQQGAISIDRILATVQTRPGLRWPILPGLMSLDAIDLFFVVARPFTDTVQTHVEVHGLIRIGKKGLFTLAATVDRDPQTLEWDPVFTGTLGSGSTLSAGEVFAFFTGFEESGLPALKIHTLEFEVSPRTGTYQGKIELVDLWRFDGPYPFAIDGVEVSFGRTGQGATWFRIDGALELDGAFVYLIARRESETSGWTFAGSSLAERPVPAGMKLDQLLPQSAGLPHAVQGLELKSLAVEYNTASQDFEFSGTTAFPVDGLPNSTSPAELTVSVALEHAPNGETRTEVSGKLALHGRELDVVFARAGSADLLVASYAGKKGAPPTLRELVEPISKQLAAVVPAGFSVDLEHVQLAFATEGAAHRFLFGIELGAGIDLAKLPLVGAALTGQKIAVVVQFLVTRDAFTQDEIVIINRLSAPNVADFPAQAIDGTNQSLQVRTALRLGEQSLPLQVQLEPDLTRSPPASGVPVVAQSSAIMQWFAVQRAFGPIHFERAGVGLTSDKQKLALVLDASMTAAGLTLSLEGLGAELELAALSQGKIIPRFHLDGLGVDFQRGELSIGGALLRKPIAGQPDQYEYDGAVAVHYKQLGIVGIGSYTKVDGHPSLFAYAEAYFPIGGPAFFNVQGVALGFGYNRSFTAPILENLETFPLVEMAMGKAVAGKTGDVAARLTPYLKPADGEYFIAAGVKFSSFKSIEGFVLLAVSFGKRFEVDVLGLATLSSPPVLVPGEAPLMKARLGIVARYQPDEGVLQVRGGLMPDAYLFSQSCHLAGGFAFSSWSKTGDFALTMGGYHPSFAVPAHYPKVPRLALSWQVDESLSIKADAYFAMTPSALMAGGHLRVNYLSGDLHAWFNAGVDCLVAWLPYHYDAKLNVSIGASYRTWLHTFTVQLTADLHVWGPNFSGTAHIDWYIFSFDISFGDSQPKELVKSKWSEVRAAFLPAREDVLTIAAEAGRTAQHGAVATEVRPATNTRGHLGAVNPRELAIRLSSAIPIKTGKVLGQSLDDGESHVGIAPMGKSDAQWTSKLTLAIEHRGADVSSRFELTPAEHESLPAGLWGEKSGVDLRGPRTVRGLTRLDLRARPPVAVGAAVPERISQPVQKRVELVLPGNPFAFAPAGDRLERITRSLHAPETRHEQRAVLDAFLPELELDVSEATINALRTEPRVVVKQ